MFGKKLKEAMRKSGYTQEELSQKTNINRSLISQWINGKKPALSSVKKVAKTLNVPINYFLEENKDEVKTIKDILSILLQMDKRNKTIEEKIKNIETDIKFIKNNIKQK